MRFLAGLLVGLVALAAYVGYEQFETSRDPCRGRCGEGTRCAEERCVVEREKRRKRRRRVRRPSRPTAAETGSEPLRAATPAQLRPTIRGPALRRSEVVDMTEDDDDAPELSEDAITEKMRRLDNAIAACIDKAREGYALASARVEIAFRVERTGQVSAVRVKAPALLQRHGIYGCVEPLVRALRFPRSAAVVVASYPYAVH